MSVYEVAMEYQKELKTLVSLAKYEQVLRTGQLGNKIARNKSCDRRGFERIHRSNLIGMGYFIQLDNSNIQAN